MTAIPGIITPYLRYLTSDSDAGRDDARQVLVLKMMVEDDPSDEGVSQTCMAAFAAWLGGWEARQ